MDTIALELQHKIGESVAVAESIKFEEITMQKGDISYNTDTGKITINKTGRYHIDWSVVTQASMGTDHIIFSLVTTQGDAIQANSPVKLGEVSGFTMIQVDAAPIDLEIINTGQSTVYYAVNTPVKAHLVLTEVLECNVGEPGPPGPGGGECAGVQLINQYPEPGEVIYVGVGEPIPFDNIHLQFKGVTYDNNTIHILESGYYLISWEFIARPIDTAYSIIVYLESIEEVPTMYGKSGTRGSDYQLINGNTLVMVDNVLSPSSFDLQLINRSSETITIASAYNMTGDTSNYFAGSLTVVKVGDVYYS